MSDALAKCGFCNLPTAPDAGLRGREVVICRACVGRALVVSISARPGPELPDSDLPCSFCARAAPRSARFAGRDGVGICTACLEHGFAVLAGTRGLQERRR